MFPRIPTDNPAFNTALALITASLAWTMAIDSSGAQSSSPAVNRPINQPTNNRQTVNPPNPTRLAAKEQSTQSSSSVLAATSKRVTDWWVPGILGGSVMVGGVALVLMLRRSNQALVTAPPEPILYSPNPIQATTPEVKASEAKASEAKASEAKVPETKAAPQAKKPSIKIQSPKNKHPQDLKPEPETVPSEQPGLEQSGDSISKPKVAEPKVAENSTIAHGPTTRMPKVSVMDVLVHDLRSPDPAKRQKAIWELGRRGDSRAVQPLVDLLLDSDSRQRSLVLSALSEISTRTLKPMSRALAISMQDENADVRKNAIRDLTRIYDTLTNISQLLHSACEDPDPEVQETAKWAIGQINRIKSPMIQGAGRSVSLPESLN
jgi:hypothetical protein